MVEEECKLVEAILDFDEEEVIEHVKNLKSNGKSALEIMEICKEAMEKIGKMFQEKEIFLTELIMSGEILKIIMEELNLTQEKISSQSGHSKGKILIGTVESDIHDIGKNIVKSLLLSNGYEVIDIGVDVPINKFVEEVKNNSPQVVAMSGLLTIAYDSMKKTIKAFEKAGIRDNFKIMIGGGSTDQQVCDYVGADGFGSNAVDALELLKQWI
ncbi:MAG: cobalamin B12-binding domain-containing protein [Promethearchaeota archaeon]